MRRVCNRAVPIVLAMIVGLLLLPLQGDASHGTEPSNGTQLHAASVDRVALSTSLSRLRLVVRRDAVEDADDADPPHPCVVAVASAAGIMVLAAPTMRESLVRAGRPRARAPP